jgi:LAO/AO transport system kinase
MTDMFVLLQLPNAGDDLQAIKKGVMELADLVVINKVDLDPDAATRAQVQIMSSLRLFSMHGNPEHAHHDQTLWHPKVMRMSALKAEGIEEFWNTVMSFKDIQTQYGHLEARRKQQAQAWMWERIEAGLKQNFRANPDVQKLLPELSEAVNQGRVAASVAARRLLDLMK